MLDDGNGLRGEFVWKEKWKHFTIVSESSSQMALD